MEKLALQGRVVLAVDLRGLGETQDRDKHAFADYFGHEWRDVFLAYLLDKSYLAMRAEDILVCARFLAEYQRGDRPHAVHLVSIGQPGPAALHAAALEPQLFASVRLRGGLTSWSAVVRTPLAKNKLVNVVHGALKTYDLTDLLSSLPRGKVTVEEPAGP
jgi:pimeloyl-ACP methyl ester carboxylesterase